MMAAFSHVDLYSKLWDGGRETKQTPRMRKFLDCYMPRGRYTHDLAIQLWRHTLMHTSRPRRLKEEKTGVVYRYLLHWGSPQLPLEQHYTIGKQNIFNIGLIYLLQDFDMALSDYLSEARLSEQLISNVHEVWPRITVQTLKL